MSSSHHSSSEGDESDESIECINNNNHYKIISSSSSNGKPRRDSSSSAESMVVRKKRKIIESSDSEDKPKDKKKNVEQTKSDNSEDSDWTPSFRNGKRKRINYKEMDEDEFELSDQGEVEEEEEDGVKIDKIMDGRIGKVGATGEDTAVYIVEDFGDPNELAPNGVGTERQFLVKWTNQSHLHNTWESEASIKKLNIKKGLGKITNFMRKEDEYNYWKSRADPDEVEYAQIQIQMEKDLAKSYSTAERIIARDVGDGGGVEYFVKWNCLAYEDATWETSELVKRYFPQLVSSFEAKTKACKIPSNSRADYIRKRPNFIQAKTQPSFIPKGLTMRGYQLEGMNWIVHSWCKNNSVILGDEMGLGKTIQAICFLSYLFEVYGCFGPFLIVVPLSTMSAWQKEFGLWAPQMNVLTYLGNEPSKKIIREYDWFVDGKKEVKFNAVLTTYETAVRDANWLTQTSWAVLIVDEAHRLKSRSSTWHRTLDTFTTAHILLMTGTPIQNSLEELWSLLHFMMPFEFPDWEQFEAQHSQGSGYAKLHKQLEPYILRRIKKDVEKSLPSKREKILRVEMTGRQREIYKHILTKNYGALKREGQGSRQTFLNMVMQLRKCCNHAFLSQPPTAEEGVGGAQHLSGLLGGSGKLTLLDKFLTKLKAKGHRVLIFSQFVIMLDIIEELLQLRRYPFQRLDGNIKGEERMAAMAHFNAPQSKDFCFLLSTRAGGLGINLATANTVIIFDSDWNPQNDLQAQARAHRIGQTKQVNVFRFVTKNTVEENVVEVAKKKMVLDHLVIQRMDTTGRTVLGPPQPQGSKSNGSVVDGLNKEELNAILKFGAEELFKKEEKGEEGGQGEEFVCDVDEILREAEEAEEGVGEGGAKGEELLSAFKVVSFANDAKEWGEIIPEDLRQKWEAEEKEREMATQLNLQRSSRKARKKHYKNLGGENSKEDEEFVPRKGQRSDSDSDSPSEKEDKKPTIVKEKKKGKKDGRGMLRSFTENELRRFVFSFKKFPMPLLRLDDIAKDADLSEKKEKELSYLGEFILGKAHQVFQLNETEKKEHHKKMNEEVNAKARTWLNHSPIAPQTTPGNSSQITPGNSSQITPGNPEPQPSTSRSISPESLTLAGLLQPPNGSAFPSIFPAVTPSPAPAPKARFVASTPTSFIVPGFPGFKIQSRPLVMGLRALEPLGKLIPLDEGLRKNWRMDLYARSGGKLRPVGWGSDWGEEQDLLLLLGVWTFGFCPQRMKQGKAEVDDNADSIRKILVTYPTLNSKVFGEGSGKSPQVNDLVARVTILLNHLKTKLTTPTRPIPPINPQPIKYNKPNKTKINPMRLQTNGLINPNQAKKEVKVKDVKVKMEVKANEIMVKKVKTKQIKMKKERKAKKEIKVKKVKDKEMNGVLSQREKDDLAIKNNKYPELTKIARVCLIRLDPSTLPPLPTTSQLAPTSTSQRPAQKPKEVPIIQISSSDDED